MTSKTEQKLVKEIARAIEKVEIENGHDRSDPPIPYVDFLDEITTEQERKELAQIVVDKVLAPRMEFVDEEEEPKYGDIVACDIECNIRGTAEVFINWFEDRYAFGAEGFNKIIQRNGKPVINVDKLIEEKEDGK